MLFAYRYVPHKMEKMQQFIDFIFFEVWCKAPIGEKFQLDLFNGNPDLKEVMSEFGFSAKAPALGRDFYQATKTIYGLFSRLAPADIYQFKKWYWGNNDLKKACANNSAAQLARYDDIDAQQPELSKHLASFFKNLSQDLLRLTALKAKIGDINSHYNAFTTENKRGKCPFCGIEDLLTHYHNRRDAYDHYLPKAIYPFNSANFHNLVPACHHCNSTYKGSKNIAVAFKDPCGTPARRKVFYPFSTQEYRIKLEICLRHGDIDRLDSADIHLHFGPSELTEQIETWKDVYGIDERYKAKLRTENDGKYWLAQALDEWPSHGRLPSSYLIALEKRAQKYPYAECNFLKQPFLDACKSVGLFNTGPKPQPK